MSKLKTISLIKNIKINAALDNAFLAIIFSAFIAATWSLCRMHPQLYPKYDMWVWLLDIWLYPLSDMPENIIIGFNIANGLRFGRDTIVVHMPGVPQYLSIFFKLFGISNETPSTKLILLATSISAFACTLLQLTCTYATLRILGVMRKWSLLIASLFPTILLIKYSTHLPLSENIIPFIFTLQIACFYRITDNQLPIHNRLVLASWSLSFLPLINILAGLTIAPTVLFLWCIITYYSFHLIKRKWKTIQNLPLNTIILPIILTVILLCIEIVNLDLAALWFWNFEINKMNLTGSPFSKILNVFWDQVNNIPIRRIFGGGILELIIFIASYLYIKKRLSLLDKKRDAFFLLIVFISGILGAWRETTGFKSAVAFAGVSWCIIFIVLTYIFPSIKIKDIKIATKWINILKLLITIITSVLIGLLIFFNSKIISKRPEAFEKANICNFRSSENCRCLQIASFMPQFYLDHDVRQCTDRYSSFVAYFFRNEIIRKNLNDDFERDDVAFLVYSKDMLELFDEHKSKKILHMFFGGGLECIPYDKIAKICYKKKSSSLEKDQVLYKGYKSKISRNRE